jgi:hypothetical protein
MHDLTPNLEPGNDNGNTVLRYLVESRHIPLEAAIEQVNRAVTKYAQNFASNQSKLLGGAIVTGLLALPVVFPVGITTALIVGSIAANLWYWQEYGTKRDRLKPEFAVLKNSILLKQFIKWLAIELKQRQGKDTNHELQPQSFQSNSITIANIIAAYEQTVFAVSCGEHLENNASDPVLALFVAKLRQNAHRLPDWVMDAFRQIEASEQERAQHLDAAYGYMFGNLSHINAPKIGANTKLNAFEVQAKEEGEQSLGKQQSPSLKFLKVLR